MEKLRSKYPVVIWSYFILLTLIILYRVSLGVDLSDESYYTTFLDGWLKLGLGNSPNLMLHQTAAWLIFPFARLYQILVGSNFGMMFFLRILYVLLSISAALSLFYFSKRITSTTIAAFVSGFAFLFIPWSLPAVSYNTIAMSGIIIALCLFGLIMLDRDKSLNKPAFLCSSFIWACIIIAYPTLLLVLTLFLIASYISAADKKTKKLMIRYSLCCVLFLATLVVSLIITLGLKHVFLMVSYTNTINDISTGFSRKWAMIHNLIERNTIFWVLALLGVCLGIFKAVFYNKLSSITWLMYGFLGCAMLYCAQLSPGVLFLHSHDLIFILALMGVYIPIQTFLHKSIPSVIVIMYCTSVFAGLVTSATAYNSLYNFHVGGLLAACLSIAFILPRNDIKKRPYLFTNIILLVCANLVMVINDYRHIYGEVYHPLKFPSHRITNGIFAGLRTSLQTEELVHTLQKLLPQHTANKSMVVLGVGCGAYLLTSLTPKALSTWNDVASEHGFRAKLFVTNFYSAIENQPDFVLSYSNIYAPYKALEEDILLHKYKPIATTHTAINELKYYRKKHSESLGFVAKK